MPVDQAAGLRRQRQAQSPTCISCFFSQAASTQLLMRALEGLGKRVLLVDTAGSQLAASRTQSLFDWRQQLQRGQLQGLPLPHGEGLFAPGAEAGDPAIIQAATTYDCVLFDAGRITHSVALALGQAQMLLLQVEDMPPSLGLSYALLKALHATGNPSTILLCGSPSARTRVMSAVRHFLGAAMARRIWAAEDEDEHFIALAARIAAEETGHQAREEAGTSPKHG